MVGKAPENSRVVIVVRKGNRPDALKLLQRAAAAGGDHPEGKQEAIQKNGRTIHPLGEDAAYWAEKDDLIVTGKDAVDTVLAVIDGKQPSAVGHPLRAAP